MEPTRSIPPLSLSLDHQSYVPYYQQVVEQVRALVTADKLREGQPFWSENEVARALGVSKMPVRQAFQKLRSEGLLVIEKGKRPVIGSGRVPWNFQELRGFSEEMRRRGLVPSARVLSSQVIGAEAEVAKALRVPAGEPLYNIRRLRLVNGNAVAIVVSYLPVRLFPNIDQHDLENRSLYAIYETIYRRRLHWAEEEIGAVCAHEEDARILDTLPGSALLRIRETTFDSNRVPIEYSCSLLRGDRYTASVISVRRQAIR
jgi:GntR family transcriptional regulator